MPTVTVHFSEIQLGTQQLGGDDEHMVSQVLFDLESEGQIQRGLQAEIKQPVGGGRADPCEVSRPTGLHGPINHDAFANAVEAYYRTFIGPNGMVVRLVEGAPIGKIRIRNSRMVLGATASFDVPPGEAGW